MQGPRTGQEIGTGPKVRRMFLTDNLRLPPVAPVSIATTTATVSFIPPLSFWHA